MNTETYQKEYVFVPLGICVTMHPKYTQPVIGSNEVWYGEPEELNGTLVCPYEIQTPDCIFVGWELCSNTEHT